ncbi:MAG: hypothetical protein V6Z82_00225 [Flavobacteriales bacterium]
MGDMKAQRDDKHLPSKEVIISRFLSFQNTQAQNEGDRIKLKEKQLDYNHDFAKKQLEARLDYLKSQEPQKRKTWISISILVVVVLSIILSFIAGILILGVRGYRPRNRASGLLCTGRPGFIPCGAKIKVKKRRHHGQRKRSFRLISLVYMPQVKPEKIKTSPLSNLPQGRK